MCNKLFFKNMAKSEDHTNNQKVTLYVQDDQRMNVLPDQNSESYS